MATNLELLQEAIGWFNDPARRDDYLALYAEDARLYGYQGVQPGRAGIAAFYGAFWTAFPDARVTLEEVFEAEDKVVARFTLSGTHTGPLQGIPPSGRPVAMSGITILRFRDGQIAERWSQADFFGLMRQIGAIAGAA